MNALTPSKVIAYLLVIFIAGGATGAMITLQNTRETPSRPHSMDKACNRMQDRLKTKLGLTEEQLKNLQPIFDQTARELRAIRDNALRETERVLCRNHEQIAAALSLEQQTKLKELEKERRDWLDRRFHKERNKSKAP